MIVFFRGLRHVLRRRGPLTDPRAEAAVTALRLLYQELEPGDEFRGMSISAVSEEGHLVQYTLAAGDSEIARGVYDGSRPEAAARAVAAYDEVFTDATVHEAGGAGC